MRPRKCIAQNNLANLVDFGQVNWWRVGGGRPRPLLPVPVLTVELEAILAEFAIVTEEPAVEEGTAVEGIAVKVCGISAAHHQPRHQFTALKDEGR